MKIFMLGWEFPPFISGGLGTACYGLTRAMDRLGIKIVFVLPKSSAGCQLGNVKFLNGTGYQESKIRGAFRNVKFRAIASPLCLTLIPMRIDGGLCVPSLGM